MLQARLEAFMGYEAAFIGQVHDLVSPAMTTLYIPVTIEEPKARSLTLSVNTFKKKKGDNLFLWNPEVKMAIQFSLLSTEY